MTFRDRMRTELRSPKIPSTAETGAPLAYEATAHRFPSADPRASIAHAELEKEPRTIIPRFASPHQGRWYGGPLAIPSIDEAARNVPPGGKVIPVHGQEYSRHQL